MAILGISTNTRLTGMAILDQGVLIDHPIHLHKAAWSAAKASQIISAIEPYVSQYSITSVVLTIPHAYHQTPAFSSLLSSIRQYFEAQRISVSAKHQQEIYAVFAPHQKKVKKALMETLCTRYPQLTYCYRREVRNKHKYFIKVFEAVAVATMKEQE